MHNKDASSTVQVGGSPGTTAESQAEADSKNDRIRCDLRDSADAMLTSFNDVLLRLQKVEAGSDLTDTVARIARRFADVHRDIIGLVSSLESPRADDRPAGDRPA
jgi:hypothetical protein